MSFLWIEVEGLPEGRRVNISLHLFSSGLIGPSQSENQSLEPRVYFAAVVVEVGPGGVNRKAPGGVGCVWLARSLEDRRPNAQLG